MDRFLDALTKYARNLTLGDPLKTNTKMGPVVSKQHYEKIKSYINMALDNGHTIICGETIE